MFTLPPRPPDEVVEIWPRSALEYVMALEKLLEQIVKRQEEQEQALREAKRQATPFRRDKNKRKRERKKAGRKGGHSQQRRADVDHVDEEHEAPVPESCPCCGDSSVIEVDCYEQTQEDIVTRVVVRKITVHVGECQSCGEHVEGRHPFQTSTARGAASHHIGPTALALAAHLHYGQGVPFDKVREHLSHLGLELSTATLVRAMERIAHRGQATFDELLKKVLEQDVLHIDETGWTVDGEPHWLWVLSGSEFTVYFVRQTRSSDEVADFLKDFAGVMVTDGAKAYDKLGKTLVRALCLLHLKRNARALEEQTNGRGKTFARDLIDWLDTAIIVVGMRDELSAELFAENAAELEADFQRLLGVRSKIPANQKMIARLTKWQDAVLLCIRDERVPATNNHAERQIRPAVVTRKRGGCNRSDSGARTFEVISSLNVSARQQGVDFVKWLVSLLRQPEPFASAPFW